MLLADWLKTKGKTGTDLACELGVDDSTINRIIPKPGKKQRRKPSYELAVQIEAATGGAVSVKELMGGISGGDPTDANAALAADPSDTQPVSPRGVARAPQKERAA